MGGNNISISLNIAFLGFNIDIKSVHRLQQAGYVLVVLLSHSVCLSVYNVCLKHSAIQVYFKSQYG